MNIFGASLSKGVKDKTTGGRYERNDRHPGIERRRVGNRGYHRRSQRKIHRKGENMQSLKNQRGQGLVEYILIVVVMALMAIGAIRALGTKTHNAFVQATSALASDMTTATSQGSAAGSVTGNVAPLTGS
jgi:Flp pilus assembly pilin Flp